MIFTTADKIDFSEETKLVGRSLENALAQAIMIAEGQNGAQRQLEITQYTDYCETALGDVYLTYFPIVLTLPIEVYVKTKDVGLFGRVRPLNQKSWSLLDSDDYTIDSESGIVSINSGYADLVKVVYSAGFSFQEPLSNEEKKIKGAIAKILTVSVTDPTYAQNIQQYVVNNFYSIQYQKAGTSKNIASTSAQDYLMELHKYRPRNLPV